MPQYLRGKVGPWIGVNATDLQEFTAQPTSDRLSLHDWVRNKMDPKIPSFQGFKLKLTESLKNLDLSGFDISGLIIERQRIENVKLRYANLAGVVIEGCNVIKTDFTGADLRGAKISRSQCTDDVQLADVIFDKKTSAPPSETVPIGRGEFDYLPDNFSTKAQLEDIELAAKRGRVLDKIELDVVDPRRSPDSAALVIRVSKAQGEAVEDKLLKLEKTYQDEIVRTTSQVLSSSGRVTKAFKRVMGRAQEDDGMRLARIVATELAKDKFLQEHFLLQDLPELQKSLEEMVAQFKSREDYTLKSVKAYLPDYISSWKDRLKKEKQRDKYYARVANPSAAKIKYDETSAWPVIDPADTAALREDARLKKVGMEFVSTCVAAGGAAAVGIVAFANLQQIPGVNLAVGGAAVVAGGATYLAGGALIKWLESHPHLIGDRMLELGTVVEYAIKPNMAITAASVGMLLTSLYSPTALTSLPTSATGVGGSLLSAARGGLTYAAQVPTGMGALASAASVALIANQIKVVKECLQEEKSKPNFMERHRPGSKQFKKTLDRELFWPAAWRALKYGIGITAVIVVGAAVGVQLFGIGSVILGGASIKPIALTVVGSIAAFSAIAFKAEAIYNQKKQAAARKLASSTLASTPRDAKNVSDTHPRAPEIKRSATRFTDRHPSRKDRSVSRERASIPRERG